ncbi:cellulose binding domain-containing protein [Micromonospora purpureochromogenes]|uniref:cellulose binding domain-containing protein n=1 Tax=Micromonospora purpureochromogenes TaxID=47872 RepID=UPI003409D17D
MSGTRRPAPRSATALASSPWIVVVTGVVVMVVLLVVALAASRSRERGTVPPPELPPTVALPDLPSSSPSRAAVALPTPVVPGLSPRRSDPPVPTPGGGPASSAGGAGAQPGPVPSPQPPPPSPVTGRYRVLEAWDDGFIGQVLLSNAAAGPRPWTVRLVPPAGSRLASSWVEGAPQGSARMSDGVFTYTSGVDLDGGASVPLRFHLEHTGGNTRPSGCTVDGTACAGL